MPEVPEEIQSLIAGIPELGGARPIRQLTGGETSIKWLLRAENRQFVLRIDRPIAKVLGLDRRTEAEILKVIGVAGIGPRLVWASPEKGVQLCTFVDGETWSLEDARNPALLSMLAHTLARLHDLPAVGGRFDPAGAAKRYADEIATVEAAELASRAIRLAEDLDSGDWPLTLCHNDLVHTNLVGRGPVRLIDWEYAAIGDPCFDLALVIRHHDLAPPLSERFLAEYAHAGQPVSTSRLRKNGELYDLLAALWYQSLILKSGSSPTFQSEYRRVMLRLNDRDRAG